MAIDEREDEELEGNDDGPGLWARRLRKLWREREDRRHRRAIVVEWATRAGRVLAWVGALVAVVNGVLPHVVSWLAR